MGCSASDLDSSKPLVNTNNFCWSHHNFDDAFIGGKKYIFYKTKHHKRILSLRAWARDLNIFVYIPTRPNIRIQLTDNEDLIQMIAFYITYEPQYETEGHKHETLVVESNTITVLPSNGKRVYEFKSIHIQPYGVLTATKWIDCDYHNNIGGVLNIHCHENIVIDKHGMINVNGAGLTGLEENDVLVKYAGYECSTNGDNVDDDKDIDDDDIELLQHDEEEKAAQLSITKNISKPINLSQFGNYCLAKGGSYFKRDKKHRNLRKNIIYHGGIGGGCISLRCRNFINHGYVVANGTKKPIKVVKLARNREMFYKLKYFANNGDQTYSGFNIKVIDVGIDGTGGFISVHVDKDFVNNGKIEAMKFGDVKVIQTNVDSKSYTKLDIGRCSPFPSSKGVEIKRKAPTAELL